MFNTHFSVDICPNLVASVLHNKQAIITAFTRNQCMLCSALTQTEKKTHWLVPTLNQSYCNPSTSQGNRKSHDVQITLNIPIYRIIVSNDLFSEDLGLRNIFMNHQSKRTSLQPPIHAPQGDLSNAVKEAVSDYVKLRGLNGLCSDVRKWNPPPGPAAFLDSGLPKLAGVGSLPRGLCADPNLSPLGEEGLRECGGGNKGNRHKDRRNPTRNSTATVDLSSAGNSSNDGDRSSNGNRKEGDSKDGCSERESSLSFRPESCKKNRVRSRVSRDSIPSPTWKVEGPEGFVSQVKIRKFSL